MTESCSCHIHPKEDVQKSDGGGWYAVDLDGTLAVPMRPFRQDEVGAPIEGTVTKVKKLLADGREVRIFTARAANPRPGVIDAIKKWCKEHLGQELEVTNEKDHRMIELWDDRARRVDSETGDFIKGQHGQAEADPSRFFDVFEVTRANDVRFKKAEPSREIRRKFEFQGLPISIETDKGEYRYWKDRNGGTGKTKMNYPYGYIRRTEGADGEEIDVYVGPDTKSAQVFIIHQRQKPDFTKYDEDKVLLGFQTPREAKAAYLEHYSDRRFFGSMTETTIDDFKRIFIAQKSTESTLDMDKLMDGLHQRKPYLANKSMDTGLVGQPPPPPMPMAPPPMPGMMPGMGMMGMGPPPTDVETFEGVQALLGRIGTVPDQALMEIASTIWGNGYMFEGQAPDQARQEIIGFLLDQRDLLGIAPDPLSMQPSASLPGSAAPGSSDYSNVSTTSQIASSAPPPGVTSPAVGLQTPSLMNWFEQDFSQRSA